MTPDQTPAPNTKLRFAIVTEGREFGSGSTTAWDYLPEAANPDPGRRAPGAAAAWAASSLGVRIDVTKGAEVDSAATSPTGPSGPSGPRSGCRGRVGVHGSPPRASGSTGAASRSPPGHGAARRSTCARCRGARSRCRCAWCSRTGAFSRRPAASGRACRGGPEPRCRCLSARRRTPRAARRLVPRGVLRRPGGELGRAGGALGVAQRPVDREADRSGAEKPSRDAHPRPAPSRPGPRSRSRPGLETQLKRRGLPVTDSSVGRAGSGG